MSFKAWALAYLIDRGMFEDQAAAVVDAWMADEANASMDGRWESRIEGYPPIMLNVLALSLNRCALSWIDANKPQAWFRGMFAAAESK